MNNHTQNDTQGAHLPQHHHPARRGHIPVKSGLSPSIPMGFSAGGRAAQVWELTKNQFALTVKNLTRFQGFDLRTAVIEKFGFWDIYLEKKNIKTAHF